MYPLDPVEPGEPDPKPPMAPPYVDEDPNLEMTRKGRRIAENEKRDSVNDEYEKQALENENEQELLDDISYPEGESTENKPNP